MDVLITQTRERISELGRLMFDRFLTDTAGGNISVRVGEWMCITPRHSGAKFQWRIRPEQVLVYDLQGNKIAGEGEISREAKVHFRLLRDFLFGKAVVHCHARHVLALSVSLQEPILPVLESTLKFGPVPIAQYAPSHTEELAEYVAHEFMGCEPQVQKQAAAVIAPLHGLFVLGKDLESAVDAAERLDVNAQAIISNPQWYSEGPASMHRMNARLVAMIESFQGSSKSHSSP